MWKRGGVIRVHRGGGGTFSFISALPIDKNLDSCGLLALLCVNI